jgi:hypothetical protein
MKARPRTSDAEDWLSLALALPLGRATLLAEEIDEVALGPVLFPNGGGLGAIVTGYRHYEEGSHDGDVARLYSRLAVARKRVGLRPPFRLARMARFLREELQRVHDGRTPPASRGGAGVPARVLFRLLLRSRPSSA